MSHVAGGMEHSEQLTKTPCSEQDLWISLGQYKLKGWKNVNHIARSGASLNLGKEVI